MKNVSFTECPVMTATFAAHQYAVQSRALYDDGILHIEELETRIGTTVDALAEKHGLEPREVASLRSSARLAARLVDAAS